MLKKIRHIKARVTGAIKVRLKKILHIRLQWLRVNEKTIVFESFQGKKFADSPRAIYEFIKDDRRYDDYRFVWVFSEPSEFKAVARDKRTSVMKLGSYRHRSAYAKAKYWVMNGWIPEYIHRNKKAGQVAMQCWHGTPLKRLRGDIEKNGDKLSKKFSTIDVPSYDYFISPSRFATDVFRSAFRLASINENCQVIETGYPRNDKLINFTDQDVHSIKEKLAIPEGKKILLYAPTWRDDQRGGKGWMYKNEMDFYKMKQQLGDEWVILFRAHYFISDQFDFTRFKDFVFDASKIDDINDLYVISDALVTDYSSVFFDYAVLKRPIVFFMYDLDNYRDNLRGFYLDLAELPGDIVKTDEGVIDIIKNIKSYTNKHHDVYDKFNSKFTYLEDGHATKRSVEWLLKE